MLDWHTCQICYPLEIKLLLLLLLHASKAYLEKKNSEKMNMKNVNCKYIV